MAKVTMKEIRNEDYVQEADVSITDTDVAAVKDALATLAGLRKTAFETLDVVEVDEDESSVVAVDYRVEGDVVIVNVVQVST